MVEEEAQDTIVLIQVITMELQEVQVVEQAEKTVEHLQVQEIVHRYPLHKEIMVVVGALLIGEVVVVEQLQQEQVHRVDLAEVAQAQELIQHHP